MAIGRFYRMEAAAGREDELVAAIGQLVEALRSVPGFEGAELMRDLEQPTKFLFIERWASVEAHKAGGPLIPKAAFGGLMGVLAGKPEGGYLETVAL